ncbi:MAG: hypothetical protein PHW10_00625, partial [Candidatus Peribacteraceae bacterium]|nr:hypothetical protein [Candidatus Peribacteraceae bacterium]
NLAFENTFNERGFHGCETVSVVGFHAATVNPGCVRLIAAIRTGKVNCRRCETCGKSGGRTPCNIMNLIIKKHYVFNGNM